MRMNQRSATRIFGLATLLLAAVMAGGCQNDEGPSPRPSGSPESPTPSWEDDFTEEQVDTAYEAIDFLHSYDSTIESFIEVGEATPEVLEYLQENHAGWRLVWDGALAAEAEGRTTVNDPGWDATTTPTEVSQTPDGYALVSITRCLDPAKTTDFVRGVEQPRPDVASYEQYVTLQRDTAGKWLISGISADAEAPCDLSAD